MNKNIYHIIDEEKKYELSILRIINIVLFKPEQLIALYVGNLTIGRDYLNQIIKVMNELGIPNEYIPKLITHNRNLLEFDNGSRVLAASTLNDFRGLTICYCYIIDDGTLNLDEFNKIVLPCMQPVT